MIDLMKFIIFLALGGISSTTFTLLLNYSPPEWIWNAVMFPIGLAWVIFIKKYWVGDSAE